jgi:flavin reductase (DIM6/NTAB) family NADH-FMN oxidoreductase RutF
MEKESVTLHMAWHIDALLHPFPVTIVTTVDPQGNINAAPYSLLIPFSSSPKNPQMLLIVMKAWHTAKNIEANGEFVINYPKADQLKDITATARYYPAGVNELDYTRYTTMPARTVRPPRIVECFQHIECRVCEIIRPSSMQVNFIADVLDISVNKGSYDIPRTKRAHNVSVPVYFGPDFGLNEQYHLYGQVNEIHSEPAELNRVNTQGPCVDKRHS